MAQTNGLGAVAVVIPTTGRNSLLRAVESVLSQGEVVCEIIVVCVKPSRTIEEASQLSKKLKVVFCDGPGLGGELRQIGTEKATSEYVAYLDDDDVLTPNSISMRLEAISRDCWLVSGRVRPFVVGRDKTAKPIPNTLYKNEQHLATWLFGERNVFRGRSILHTSSLLLKREVALSIGWTVDLVRHQDWDFIIRGSEILRGDIFQLGEVVAEVETGTGGSVSALKDAKSSLDWFLSVNEYFDSKSQASFLVGQVGRYALASRDWATLRTAFNLLPPKTFPPLPSLMELILGALPRAFLERAGTVLSGGK